MPKETNGQDTFPSSFDKKSKTDIRYNARLQPQVPNERK
jgi:hypothetical protein